MRPVHEQVRTIHLDHEQLLILDGGREGRVRVLYGGAWLTEEGERDDAFLHAGHEAPLHGRRTVVQAQGPGGTDVQVVLGARGAGAGWWQRVRALAARWQFGPVPDACA